MKLRPYQQEAVDAVWQHIAERDDNPCVVIPTAGGKTPVMATLCRDAVVRWGGRVLILAHVKELLEQTVDKLNVICPEVKTGVYSAGLKRKEKNGDVVVGQIQSIYKKATEFDPFNLLIIDEAHLISPDEGSMYQQFISDAKVVNPDLRVIGLTATPYRTGSGYICQPDGMLNHICYEVSVRELIDGGFISKLINKSALQVDTSRLSIRMGEFDDRQSESLMLDIVEPACREIVKYTADRKSVLVFCQTIAHAEKTAITLEGLQSAPVDIVTGQTVNRETILTDFKAGELKYLVNVNVLTTGFDAPNIDCVALLRPTMSPGLFYQMVGRGFRLSPGKENCLVLDFGNNVERHGTVDAIVPKIKGKGKPREDDDEVKAKVCPSCRSLNPMTAEQCEDCGAEFPKRFIEPSHDTKPDDKPLVSDHGFQEWKDYDVMSVSYAIHKKKDWEPGLPRTMRVDYQIGLYEWISQWICVEHPEGFAKAKARQWWQARSRYEMGGDVEECVMIAKSGGLAPATAIRVRRKQGDKFPTDIVATLGPIPNPDYADAGDDSWSFGEQAEPQTAFVMNEDDVPF